MNKILIVEDEVVVARDIRQQLKLLNYDPVASTATGEEAVLLAERLRPDLVLMDIQLAGDMDGIIAAHTIRERFDIPVVFLTAFVGDQSVQRAKLAEPFGYIVKPLEECNLKITVSMALYKHQADKAAQKQLQQSNELLSLFMEHLPFLAYIKEVNSSESRVIKANKYFQNTIGITGSEIVGKTMAELFSTEFAAQITADDWAVVSGGRVLKRDEDLNGRNYATIKFPILQGGKNLLAGYTIDITERKRADAEKERLEAQNRQLQKSESLGRMAGAIAHHFNNQLQVVMMNLEIAMQGQSSGEFPTENLNGAMESARKAAEVSGLMLTYLGQTNCIQEPLDVSETCQQSLSLLRAIMPQGVILEAKLPSDGPTIKANANQLQQVLTNLVTNAWEAIDDGHGTIHLTVKMVPASNIPVANRFPIDWHPQDNAYACLEVADEGCGIADKAIETLFDPFYSSKFTGRGLGLSVVLGIVRAHHGIVTVESLTGRGSVFRVFLPISAEAVPRKSVPVVAQAPKRTGGGTVLVVDDETSVREVLKTVIEVIGFTVLCAKDGVEAMEVFRQHQDEICLVLCDLTMPRMDGWETLTALRLLAPGIPVILSSGYSEAQVMAGDHPELPQAFLSKPCRLVELREAFSRVLNRKAEGITNACSSKK
jgi:PAS domain S-box-containing protein